LQIGVGVFEKPGVLYNFAGMEDKYLYPGEEVQPVEVGEGYRDYWLSDVLKPYGGFVKLVRVGCHWRDGWASCFVKFGRIVDGEWELLWLGNILTPKGFVVHKEAKDFIEEEGAHTWTDVKVRYYVGEAEQLSFPNCIAARHIWDYDNCGKHVDAYVDFISGEHHWTITDK